MRKLIAVLLVLSGVVVPCWKRASAEDAIKVVLSLEDGSRIVGACQLEQIPLQSETMGLLRIPATKIKAIKFNDQKGGALLSLANGDSVQGTVDLPSLQVNTSFGMVKIPLGLVRTISLQKTGGAAPEFDALPFPVDSDWPAGRGALAVVDPEGTILRGQPVRTRQTYSLPLHLECEATLEQGLLRAAEFSVLFLPPETPQDREPTSAYMIWVRSMDVDRDGGPHRLVFAERRNGRWAELWRGEPFYLKVAENYSLSMELTPQGTQIKFNNQTYDVKDVVIPYAKFQLQVRGWVPDNRWRLRNFVTH